MDYKCSALLQLQVTPRDSPLVMCTVPQKKHQESALSASGSHSSGCLPCHGDTARTLHLHDPTWGLWGGCRIAYAAPLRGCCPPSVDAPSLSHICSPPPRTRLTVPATAAGCRPGGTISTLKKSKVRREVKWLFSGPTGTRGGWMRTGPTGGASGWMLYCAHL